MSHQWVVQTVSQIVPCCHMEWPAGSVPDLPWATYHGKTDPFSADDYQLGNRVLWTVELYEKRRNKKLEDALEAALRKQFGTVKRNESYIENDNMLMVAFSFSEIELIEGDSDA